MYIKKYIVKLEKKLITRITESYRCSLFNSIFLDPRMEKSSHENLIDVLSREETRRAEMRMEIYTNDENDDIE